MKVWLVNPFDPLPGGPEQWGRYAQLATALVTAGHHVIWWSSTFSHRFKRQVDEAAIVTACKALGMDIQLLRTPPYQRNVSLRRMHSHRAFGEEFFGQAQTHAPPDIILASSPPLESAMHAAKLARQWNISCVIDIQDQWPDNFVRVMPSLLRPFRRLLLARLYGAERSAYSQADAIIGVAQGYVDHGTAIGGAKLRTGVFPLGVDVDALDATMAEGRRVFGDHWRKPDGQVWFLYSGSLSHNYDVLTIIRAARLVQRKYGDCARFMITGTGELANQAAALVRNHGLTNVTLTGFLDFMEWACILSQADAGFNASFPDALIYLPNKIFYYLTAGAAVLNTIPGECEELVRKHDCGLTYRAGNPQDCFAAVSRLIDSANDRRRMGANARKLAAESFDRRAISQKLVEFLVSVSKA